MNFQLSNIEIFKNKLVYIIVTVNTIIFIQSRLESF